VGKEKNFIEDVEWILKSIVYFCQNYTMNGKDMDSKAHSAVKTYLSGRGGNIDDALNWEHTQQKEGFWSNLWYLSSGDDRTFDIVEGVKPWTRNEKRMIDKLPKVNR
jgi:hypothetical protein